MGPIEDLGKAINGIAEGAGRSTVGIGNRWRGGSGVVVEAGKVLTNAHNLHGDEIRVFFADGREADGKVLGADGDGDLAVIGVDTGEAPAIELGRRDDAGHRRAGGRHRQPGRPGRARHARLRLRAGPRLPRAARAVAWWAPWSTPLPCCPARPAARSSTATASCSASTPTGWAAASTRPSPPDAALKDRVAALGRGEAPTRRRLGVGLAPVARRATAAPRGGPGRARRAAGARSRGRLAGRQGRRSPRAT